MINIRGVEDFKETPFPDEENADLPDDKAMISGPLNKGGVSQEDIDALFD